MPERHICQNETSFRMKLSDSEKKSIRVKTRNDVDAHFQNYDPPQKFKFEEKLTESSALITISYLERTFFLFTRINNLSSS